MGTNSACGAIGRGATALAAGLVALAIAILATSSHGAASADTSHFNGIWQNANGNDWQNGSTSPANLSFSHGLLGWFKGSDFSTAPDYQIGLDPHAFDGRPAGFIRSRNSAPQGHAGLEQGLRLDHYRGKRVHISAMLRTKDVASYACLFVHLDTETSYSVLGAPQDNLSGTTPWRRYDVVLDIPGNAQGVYYGAMLQGAGEVWMARVRVEVVGRAARDTHIWYTVAENTSDDSGFNGTGWANWSVANPTPEDLDFSSDTDGWFQPPASHATANIDLKGGPTGEPCLVLTPTGSGTDAWASLQQLINSKNFLGKRVRFTALIKGDNLTRGADMMVRVASPKGSPAAASTIAGTTGWKASSLVVDVPKDSPGFDIGFTVGEGGTLRVADVRIEAVGKDVPLTPAYSAR